MPDRLPPLTALRAFDAAQRHMSFAKAAEELHVTPAALSYQIKSLEEHLGAALFHRLNRAVALTEMGETLAPGIQEGFQALSAAWRSAQRQMDDATLMVTAGPAFTAKWFAPRFYEFARAHPDIDLRFSATLRNLDFNRDEVDVAIRFGTDKEEPGLWSFPMAREWVTPVMTPDMAERFPTPESLRDATLIHDESIDFLRPRADWAAWCRLMDLNIDTSHGPRFTGADHSIDAALAGAGIALGRRALVVKDIHEGRLVAPYRHAIWLQARFRFLCREGTQDRPHIAALHKWMMEEIEKTAEVTDALTLTPIEEIPAA
ncbi:transcriptional regulator GcvA [Shimia marina]|uniref:Gcv operon activator n=1 Tax=Shimia marina TaxID=321267 RepID=A0A0N7LSQ3_9RHOB|nr:transcriptional regulator GcvA [Shimia marina]CUH54260.1 Gcv operon activator [Shimia marina]SFD98812.1 transcriptional regulator, LysR family [Shimia marina]